MEIIFPYFSIKNNNIMNEQLIKDLLKAAQETALSCRKTKLFRDTLYGFILLKISLIKSICHLVIHVL